MSELGQQPTSDRTINLSSVPGANVSEAMESIVAFGAISNPPAATIFLNAPPDTRSSVGTTPAVIDVMDVIGINDRVTVDAAGAKFTIENTGRYLIGFTMGISGSSNNTTVTVGIHVNGSPTAAIDLPIFLKTSGEEGVIGFTFPVDASVGDFLDFRISVGTGTQTITYDEASCWIVQQAVSLATLEGAVESINHQNEDGTERTYYVGADEVSPGVINEIRLETDSGTLDYTVKINGVNITGLVNVEANSTKATYIATALNVYAAGGTISYVTSSDSTSVAPRITIKTTRS